MSFELKELLCYNASKLYFPNAHMSDADSGAVKKLAAAKWFHLFSDGNWSHKSTLEGAHERTVRCVTWSPCGKYIASASFDATTVVWEKKDGKLCFPSRNTQFFIICIIIYSRLKFECQSNFCTKLCQRIHDCQSLNLIFHALQLPLSGSVLQHWKATKTK